VSEPIDLPPVSEALLDEETLARLFADLELAAEVLGVVVRRRAGRLVEAAGDLTLADARALFDAGDADGVQIRYRHDGWEWRDTLMRTAQGVRLVRVRHPHPEEPR
jgi:hypothetical protein